MRRRSTPLHNRLGFGERRLTCGAASGLRELLFLAMDACGECGFVYEQVTGSEVPQRIRSVGVRSRAALLPVDSEPNWDKRLRQRPEPTTWSALEYACHLRDVL